MAYSLGVDLGTTASAAALRHGTGLEACTLGDLTATMPSVALERADGSFLVGEAAADRTPYEPTLVARHVTARLADQGPIVLDGRPQDPARLTQALLETVIDRVRRFHGDRPRQVVLTYPLFPPGASAALLDRVARASVGGAVLIPHPVAAVAKLAHDVDIAVGTTVAVLDLGGGTFEATIVRRTGDGFDVVGPPGGLPDLGGVEIDEAVLSRVDAELGNVLQTVDPEDVEGMAALQRLRMACREAKERLSYSTDATVEVSLPHLSTGVPITRTQLEEDIRPWLVSAVDVVAQTIAAADLSLPDVHVALLVGGSSRIPLFGELVAGRLGLPIVADPFPELTVALGAALFGDDDPASAGVGPPAIEADPGDDVGALAAWFIGPGAGEPATAGPAAEATMPWADPPQDLPPVDSSTGGDEWGADQWVGDQWPADQWEGDGGGATWAEHRWTSADEPWDDADETAALDPPTASDRRVIGPTTGETDLWGAPRGRRWRHARSADDDGDEATSGAGPPGNGRDGANPRLVVAIIGGALAVVAIAGVALATGMSGPDEPPLTLADPAGSAITTSTTTTSTPITTTTTTAPTTTTTTTEPEPEPKWEPPPPAPSTTVPPTTAAPTTTTAPPPTTTSTTRPPTTTTTRPKCPGPPSTTSTTTTCPGPQ
jgi:hypothetical protein